MKNFFQKKHRLLFYACWLVFGLIQSRFTELLDDEAYYWAYSRYLDWGYFDHPPMIAVLIKMGYAIFPNELGVRLFPLLLNILSLVIIEKLIDKKNSCLSGRQAFLFYAIALSMAVIQLTGFIAVPDIPLIFFTALFFWCYKKFIGRLSLLNTLLLGISIALLFYSKYHAVLIVFFTMLSNTRLFTKYQTYIAGIIGLLLFMPHLWWQYQHDWVSVRYHLFESNVNPYRFSFTLNYVFGQLLLPGPFAGFILLPAAFLYTPKKGSDSYRIEKALRFTMVGIYAFFLLSSFRGKVENNWTSPALVPLFILSYKFLVEKLSPIAIRGQKFLYKLLPVTLVLVLFARIIMIADILPLKVIKTRYHAWKKWPEEMKKRTKGLPVVFSSSYQRASKYWFYSGQKTFSQNYYGDGINNYDFWPVEDSLLGKPVYFLDIYRLQRFSDSLKTPVGWVGYRYDSSFASFTKVKIDVTPKKISIEEGHEFVLNCRFRIPPLYADFIQLHRALNDTTRIGFFNSKGLIREIFIPLTIQQMKEQKEMTIRVNAGLPKGKYFFRFAINCGDNNATHNSNKIELKVE